METSRAAVNLARNGHPKAVEFIRESGQLHGGVLATAVSLLNPRILKIDSDLLRAEDHFMSGLRERLYQRTQPMATRKLQILTGQLGDRSGPLAQTASL